MRVARCLFLMILLSWASASWADRVVVVAGGGDSPADAVPKPATDVTLVEPFAVAFDANGNMYIAELEGGRVLRVSPQGQLRRFAGRTEKGDKGDGGPAERAVFNGMHHLLIGPGGGLVIADTWNNRLRWIDLDDMTIGPFAGTGGKGFAGDGGPARDASFGGIYCLALGPGDKTLYLADLDNRRIRAIDVRTNLVRTIAGNDQLGVPDDGALAVEAPLVDPRAVAVDSAGNVYILERSGHALRVVDRQGRIRTVVGTGKAGHSGDDGPALDAQLNGPKHLCIDAADNVLIADTENHVIRKYWPATGRITHIAGTGQEGAGGLDGPASQVQLSRPHGVLVGPDGHLYISDSGNGRVLRIEP